jgi:hypothetical protein
MDFLRDDFDGDIYTDASDARQNQIVKQTRNRTDAVAFNFTGGMVMHLRKT